VAIRGTHLALLPGMQNERDERGFSQEGAVFEILERGGERFAKILIAPNTVLELPVASLDISLGDRVGIDASLNIRRLERAAPGDLRTPGGGARFADYQHVLRIAVVFVAGVVLFLVWRSWMVPEDFGVYGHYRAGAIAEAASQTPVFSGQASCIDCHSDVQEVRAAGRHAQVTCEACHGPLGIHARGETDVAPIRPSNRGVCLGCHIDRPGMPVSFPKIIVNEHSESGPCTDCHKSHAPGIS
jgi:hypothetical protein